MSRRALPLALLALGCAPSEPTLVPTLRLVDAVGAAPATATIDDEQRMVLDTVPRHDWATMLKRPPPDGELRHRIRLPARMQGSARLLLQPLARSGDRWQPLDPQILDVGTDPSGPYVDVAIPLRGSEVRSLTLEAYGLAPEPRAVSETAPIVIEAGTRLEAGLGILELAHAQGPVRFRIEACPDERCETILDRTLDPERAEHATWQDVRVSLADFAGREIRLRFLTSWPGDFSLPVWSNPTLWSPAQRESGPNLVLISLDTLRADHLPLYGHAHDTAPFLSRAFGAEGVVVDRLQAVESTTSPTHMTMFTGLWPSVHGVTRALRRLPEGVPTLGEILYAQGFATGAVTENAVLNVHQGFGRGFTSYTENKSSSFFEPVGEIEHTLARARAWLERQERRRFFLFVHTYQVHFPYTPPERYAGLFADASRSGIPAPYDPALYDREIRYVDDQLRSFLGWLEERGLAHDTLVVVTSDHGEAFGEHGLLGHGPQPHQEVLHVPLLLRGAGLPRGRRVPGTVSQVDLLPTLLDLLGIPSPALSQGRSFADSIRAAAPEPDSRPAYSEAWASSGLTPALELQPVEFPSFAVLEGQRKLVAQRGASGFRYLYFDLASDPAEQRDLYPERAHEAADLRRLLDGYPERAAAARRELPADPGPARIPKVDPERAEKLRALGYVE